jgi:hypothetical protein
VLFFIVLSELNSCCPIHIANRITILLLQRDTAGLSAENNELKIRLQNTEHQVHLQDGKSLSFYSPIY